MRSCGPDAYPFQASVGCSLLPFAETVYTETGQLVALSFNYFVTDRFSFTINRRTERVARRSAG